MKLGYGTSKLTATAAAIALLAGFVATTTAAPALAQTDAVIKNDFESGLGGFEARHTQSDSTLVVATSTDYAVSGSSSAKVSGRKGDGDGIRIPVQSLLTAGATYTVSAQVRYAEGATVDPLVFSAEHTVEGKTNYSNLVTFDSVKASGWTEVSGKFKMPEFDSGSAAYIYFESKYQSGNTSDFYVDDISISQVTQQPIQTELTPLKNTVGDMNFGVAIDERETAGAAGDLVKLHFNQITAENHMKPEAWYDDSQNFSLNSQAKALMDFAAANDIDYYGHVLTWHSQTPDWFFQDSAGNALTSSATDQEILKTRLRTHIENIAKTLSQSYGLFGSPTNPLVAWDVVNEVVSDGAENADGLRRSPWFNILGEQYIDLSFEYAEEFFNGTYADPSVTRPVKLFINDYNTEQDGKQTRYKALVERLIARSVPLDGVGHQFHVNISTPVSSLDGALRTFDGLSSAHGAPLLQAVTEFDVTTGTPVSQAKLIEQGHYYKDAFDIFRNHAQNMFSVTVWGLTDDRSWRDSDGAPLIFDESLQAKPAYFGAIGGEGLPNLLRSTNVFGAIDGDQWGRLPAQTVGDSGSFELRWQDGYLFARVAVKDTSVNSQDSVTFDIGGTATTVTRQKAKGSKPGKAKKEAVISAAATSLGVSKAGTVEKLSDGYAVAVALPVSDIAVGSVLNLNVSINNSGTSESWAGEGATGTVTVAETYSFAQVPNSATAPVIDGVRDRGVWDKAVSVVASKNQQSPAAQGTAQLVWNGTSLYVFAHVVDPAVDWSGSDPWIQDSIELYIDRGNAKNGSYRSLDSQIRIGANGAVSFGTGSEAEQAAAVRSVSKIVDDGYVIEAEIDLFAQDGKAGAFQGFDFQINDADSGSRVGMANWADATGMGYQSTAHWGVLQLKASSNSGKPSKPSKPQKPGQSGKKTSSNSASSNGGGHSATIGGGSRK